MLLGLCDKVSSQSPIKEGRQCRVTTRHKREEVRLCGASPMLAIFSQKSRRLAETTSLDIPCICSLCSQPSLPVSTASSGPGDRPLDRKRKRADNKQNPQ
jgi:hypothetical protein